MKNNFDKARETEIKSTKRLIQLCEEEIAEINSSDNLTLEEIDYLRSRIVRLDNLEWQLANLKQKDY